MDAPEFLWMRSGKENKATAENDLQIGLMLLPLGMRQVTALK